MTESTPGIEVIAELPGVVLRQFVAGKITSKQGARWLTFAIVDRNGKSGPPIFGTYKRRGNRLIFVPRFPPAPGSLYRATLRRRHGGPASVDYRAPMRTPEKAAVVQKIYPTATSLPANTLKFYIHFSKPMREGKEIFDAIRLVDDRGQHIDDAWRRVEIWSSDYKRLTLFVHPGRIKTGVNLRSEIGPVLEPGRKYHLIVGTGVRDARGAPMAKAYRKTFRASAADSKRPLPQRWKLIAPRSGTREPLRVEFKKPLDRLLLTRMLTVQDAHGRAITGRIEIDKTERGWRFHPASPWTTRTYKLEVDGQLEDLAGNTPIRVFDRDIKQPRGVKPQLSRSFRPIPPNSRPVDGNP